ncbi:adenylate/guanylate cyclase domain-containing protein [Permianibacter sp. IMCC34836]|uniref:adenylate/guanylate cyclase domain-containing protein n=1 Tax=Permianibacter fluminis TaxID=2738515 RepID=UPI001555F5D0|nr:adenylate/guanylate cyclase domain-containing protein [Permianibacter fluminis]NQD37607.1 adenylate/guanylate cyclase domain-containing protein [Permianibacter fluminis]
MITRRNRLQNRSLLLALALTLLLLLLGSVAVPLQRLDFLWLDALTRLRAEQQLPDPSIVVIDIDDYSMTAMEPDNGSWPWARGVHAELVNWLTDQGAKKIVFDIWFSERDKFRGELDDYFAETLASHDNVYMPTLLQNSLTPQLDRRLDSYPPLAAIERTAQADPNAKAQLILPAIGKPEHWRLGLINFVPDADGVARRYSLYRDINGWRFYSLPAVVARDLGYALPGQATLRLDWRARKPPYPTYSYADVFAKALNADADDRFRDKVVFIGSTASGNHDLRPTAVSAQYPALYMLAITLDNIKNHQELAYSAWWQLGYGSVLLLWLFWRIRSNTSLSSTTMQAVAAAALLILLSVLAIRSGVLIAVVTPLLAALLLLMSGALMRYLRERDARTEALDLFGRFLDPNVVEQLARDGLTDASLAARHCDITVLFSDIRGFTTLSEKQPAPVIMSLLNDYFSQQVACIFRHQGTLDKFIGDAIMAFWGAPLDDERHAYHAVAAALDMCDELQRFVSEKGLTDFDIGIGVHTGPAVVGMLGSEQRYEYTAIGDTVNLASRMEGLTKGVARVLVSQSTRDACVAQTRATGEAFDFIACGEYKVKGRAEPVVVYEPRRRST